MIVHSLSHGFPEVFHWKAKSDVWDTWASFLILMGLFCTTTTISWRGREIEDAEEEEEEEEEEDPSPSYS